MTHLLFKNVDMALSVLEETLEIIRLLNYCFKALPDFFFKGVLIISIQDATGVVWPTPAVDID